MLKDYLVYARVTETYKCVVTATSEKQAKKMVLDGDWDDVLDSEFQSVDSIESVKEI